MKRLHLHIKVSDLDASKAFYSALFDMAPTVDKPGYVKWMVEDPKVNFAISPSVTTPIGLNHLGIQVESGEELAEMEARLQKAEASYRPEENATCCYANSDKHWALGPDAMVWEMFHTMGEAKIYGDDVGASEALKAAAAEPAKEAEPYPHTGCC